MYSGAVVLRSRDRVRLSSLLPPSVFALSFILLALLSFGTADYFWPEPGMYTFFFLAVALSGTALSCTYAADRFARFFVAAAAGSCFLYGAMSINVYLFALFDGVSKITDYIPWGFVHIRYWSHVATWLLPLLPLAVLVGPLKGERLWRWGVTLAAGLWWWIVFLSTARGSIVGIAFGAFVTLVLIGRSALPWLKVLGMHIATGGLIWWLLSVVVPSLVLGDIQLRPIKLDSSGRGPLFLEAWRMSLENFPFGMGPQSWLTHDLLTEAYATSRKYGHPHNMYLMWAAEYGWLLVAAFGLVCIQAARNVWRARRRALLASDSQTLLLLTGFTASVLAALCHAGVSAVFMAPASMLVGLFVLIGFWALSLPEPMVAQPAEPRVRRARRGHEALSLSVIVVLSLAWFAWAWSVWAYYQDMRKDEITYFEQGEGGITPRFWFHGNFPR